MQRPILAAAAVCLVAAAPAAYADLSYSYVEGAVAATSTDTALGEQSGNAGEADFSYSVLKLLHVFASYRMNDFDHLSQSTQLVTAGAGFNYAFSPTQSVYVDLAGTSAQADSIAGGGTIGPDDTGYSYAIGYRESRPNGKIEFDVKASRLVFDDTKFSNTSIDMDLLFRVTPRFKIDAGIRFIGDENAFRVGARYYLPNRFDRSK